MVTTPTEQAFLTVNELAVLLRVSRRTAYVLVETGQVPSVRFGGSIRIPRAALVQQLSKTMRKPAPFNES
jgi:excisionase family DNA binding protein